MLHTRGKWNYQGQNISMKCVFSGRGSRVIKMASTLESLLGVKANVKCPQGKNVKWVLALVHIIFLCSFIFSQFLPLCFVSIWLVSSPLHFRILSLTGLSLIALGTGGIKPCVAAFGGDQFEEKHVRSCYFHIFKNVE